LFISNKINNCPYLTYENLLAGILPNKIALRLVINCGFKPDEKVSLSCISKITKAVKNTSFVITGDTGFDNSQVTHGGVLTCDFNDKTMESKLVSGLYAVGEVLDIDGDCGGYNLQWAFSSAMTASKDIK
jgi:predicted flavoprotein YhiN